MAVPIYAQCRRLSFIYGDETLSFERVARPDRCDRIRIKVYPDCRVVVAAPESAADEAVRKAAKKRARWIYRQLRGFRQQLEHVIPRQYVSGESHFYLGKRYLLKITVEPDTVQRVRLYRGRLDVSVRARSAHRVQKLLAEWYKARARDVFVRRLDVVLEQTLWVTKRPPIRLLTMQTQWGSCSLNGRLILNPQLVKAPRQCIDYVLLHELCHLAEHNHSERFYRLMEQVMPDWQPVKERLDGMAGLILGPLLTGGGAGSKVAAIGPRRAGIAKAKPPVRHARSLLTGIMID